MNIAIIGNDDTYHEAKLRLGDNHQYSHFLATSQELINGKIDVIFDFNSEWSEKDISVYGKINVPVFLNTIFTTLKKLNLNEKARSRFFGFCGLPTFFNRSRIEVTILENEDEKALEEISKSIGLEYSVVKDQVGMVTPRVICMIINEAFDALKQGVASREDIDLSMKLGTNYPFGPFEWADRIGLDNIKKLMNALEESTNDLRFIANF